MRQASTGGKSDIGGGSSSSSQIRKRCVRYKSCCNVSLHLLLRLDGRLPLRRLAVRRWFEEEAPLFCSKRWRRWRWRWSCCETPSSTDSKALRRGSPLPLSLRSIRLRSVDCKGAAKKGLFLGDFNDRSLAFPNDKQWKLRGGFPLVNGEGSLHWRAGRSVQKEKGLASSQQLSGGRGSRGHRCGWCMLLLQAAGQDTRLGEESDVTLENCARTLIRY